MYFKLAERLIKEADLEESTVDEILTILRFEFEEKKQVVENAENVDGIEDNDDIDDIEKTEDFDVVEENDDK